MRPGPAKSATLIRDPAVCRDHAFIVDNGEDPIQWIIQEIILDNDHGVVVSKLTSMPSHEHHRASGGAMVVIQDNFLDYPLDTVLHDSPIPI